MKISTLILLTATIVLTAGFGNSAQAQSILNPADSVITYNPAAPPTQPAANTIGKWVRTVRVGWNTSNYKCYIYNGIPFRLRFPKSYNPTANDGKKYPVLIFFHGDGEGGPATDNEYSLFHGGQLFDQAVTNGTFDGYVFVMQTANGFWGQPDYTYIQQILDYMVANNKLDPFRININGLSAGGAGVWDFGIALPNYTAAAVPMSAACLCYDNTAPPALKFTPVWLIQGGLDGSPSPSTTDQLVAAMNNAGAHLTYTLFPNDGHDTWDDTWSQPNFWPFLNSSYSSNPWALGGRSQFCTGDPINLTVGVAPGFQAYQWRMNGTIIPSATSNTINVTQLGTYDARVENNGVWSDWSHTPLVVAIKAPTVSPNITIPALTSNVIPALDTTTGVKLTVPTGYASYVWQAVNGNTTLSTSNTLFTNTPGQYHVQVTEQFGCSSSFSNPYTVIPANGPNPPSAAANLIVTPISQTSLRLDWTVNPSQQFPQTGFEVYQASSPGGPFKIIAIAGPNATSDTAAGLHPGSTYYYKIRAVNGTAAAPASNVGSGTTTADNQPPTAPTNLTVTGTTRTSVSLAWQPSTDNVGVTKYDIYVNGVKIGFDTSGTSFTVYNLNFGTSYAIAVTARDFAGNISPFSNQVTAQALQTGWTYKYYTFTGTWNNLQNLASMTPVKTGYSTTLDLGTRTQDNNFAYLFEGYLHVTVAGTYTFRTNSDDGSALYLGSAGQTTSAYNFPTAPLVNNDGLHGAQDRNSTAVTLQPGIYPIAVAFYQQGGGFSVTASWSTPQTGAGNFVQIPLSALSDTATVNGQPPAAPSNLVATTQGTNKIGLSWTDNSNNETAFEIWRASDSLGTTFTTIATIPYNRVSYIDSTASAATRYWYKVRAIGQYGQSDFDKMGPGMAYKYYSLAGSPSKLPSPAQLAATLPTATGVVSTISVAPAQTTTNFILAFSGVINLATAGTYTFYTSSDDGSDLYVDGTDSAHLIVKNDFLQGQTERSGTVTLSAGSHTIYVPFFQAGGGFVLTASIQGPGLTKQQIPASIMGQPYSAATTLPLPGAPAAPSGLVAHGTSTSSSVTIHWTDNANNENSYQLYRSSVNNLNYVLLATLPANTVSYTDTGLFANAAFYYKVRAVNQGGNSAFSNEDSAHTQDVLPVLTPIAAQYMHYGTTLSLNVSATVNSSDALALTVANLPAFGSFSSTGNGTGVLTFNPAQSDPNVYNNITVTATDQHGGSVSQAFNLTVNSNFSPVIARPVNNVSINEKQTSTINLSATDQNAGDAITWSFTGLPGFVSASTSAGAATLTLTPGYADAGTYNVQARVDDGNHGFDTVSFNITVVPVPLPTTSVYTHFSDGSAGTVAGSPWNNTSAVPTQNLAVNNLLDQNGANSGLGLTITSPWQNVSPANGSNTLGATTGNNSGVYPDVVLSSAYYTDANSQTIRVSGMDTGTKYSFTFLGSRGGVNDDRTTVYSVTNATGTSSVSLQAANNTANTVSINNVQPNADGTVVLTLARGTSSLFGYLNALVITKQFNDHTAPARARDIAGQFVNNRVSLTWTAAAYNANSYQVYRSTTRSGGYALQNPGATNPTQSSFTDSTIAQNNTYYYYVTATNSYGVSPSSDTVTMVVPNLAPALTAVTPVSLAAQKTVSVAITATDPGDVITLTTTGLPRFATFTDNGGGQGTLNLAPSNLDIGIYSATITATDNHGASSVTPVSITVSAAAMRNIYINFNDGSASEPAQGAPWNNMNSAPNAGAGIANLKDDSAFSTGFGISLVDAWSGANNVGPVTGNNSGVFPDNVMQSLYYDGSGAGSPRHINITGLSAIGKYNLIFYAGRGGVTDNRITHYTVGSQSVQLNAASNTSQTVEIAGVSPDATGKIQVLVAQDAGASFGYLNAMQIQYAFDTAFYAPTNLVAIGPSASTIKLNWVSNSPSSTTGFEVWRSANPTGPFSLLSTVSGSTTSYTDAGLTPGSGFFYEVRALAGARQSAFSNIAGGSTVAYNVEIQFNDGAQNVAQGTPWNSINTLIFPGFVLPNMVNTQNQHTGINLGMIANFTGYNVFGTTTGNNSGIYPDNVMQGFYYMNFGDTSRLIVTGLNLTSTYNFNFFGSRANPSTSVMSTYQIGSQVATLDATNNTTRTVQIAGVRPDSTGSIVFSVYNTDGGRAYLNALTIDIVPSAFSGFAQTPVATQDAARIATGMGNTLSTSGLNQIYGNIGVTAYPNPFTDAVSLNLTLDKPADKLTTMLIDVTGRVLFEQEFDNVPQGNSGQRLDLNAAALSEGTYFVIVKGFADGRTRAIPMVKRSK